MHSRLISVKRNSGIQVERALRALRDRVHDILLQCSDFRTAGEAGVPGMLINGGPNVFSF